MAKTIIMIHGRAPKPSRKDLESLWNEALRYGIQRDHVGKIGALDQATIDFVYYGDLSNAFLDSDHDLVADAASRRVTLEKLKTYSNTDLLNKDTYNDLEGKSTLQAFQDEAVSALSWLFGRTPIDDPVINKVAPDMKQYWNPDSELGTEVRFRMIQPLKDVMDRNDDILVIAHSLGTMIAYDTFWKFSRMGEYRPRYNKKKIDLFVTIGSPLGDDTVKGHLKGHLRGSTIGGPRKFPSNIRRWVNIATEDDYVAHDPTLENDYRSMKRYGLIDSIDDKPMYNAAVRNKKSNPYHRAGYLSIALNPKAQSPLTLTTGTSGRASFAPTANGTPTPMQPLEAELRRLAGV